MKFICLYCERDYDAPQEKCLCGRKGMNTIVSEKRFWELAAQIHLKWFQHQCLKLFPEWSCKGCSWCKKEMQRWKTQMQTLHQKHGWYLYGRDEARQWLK